MLHVSIFVEGLRSQPRLMFWLAGLGAAGVRGRVARVRPAVWGRVLPLSSAAPPAALPMVLAVGHELQLGTDLGPPLAFWLAEAAYDVLGFVGAFFLSQASGPPTYWAVFTLGRAIVGAQHAAMAVLLMLGITVMTVPSPDFGPAMLGMAFSAL